MGPTKAIVALLAIEVNYVVVGYLLYQARVLTDDPVFNSDLFVFIWPAIMTIVASAAVTVSILPIEWPIWFCRLLGLIVGIAMALFGFSVYGSMVFTRYGT